MKGTMTRFLLFGVTVLSLCADPKSPRDWKIGKVLDSELAKSYIVTTSTNNRASAVAATSPNGASSAHTEASSGSVSHITTVRQNQLVIVGSEFAYVVNDTRASGGKAGAALIHAVANRHHGCRFIVGDDVRFAQQKAELFVLDADGKECKVEILRQERLNQEYAGNEAPKLREAGEPLDNREVIEMVGIGLTEDVIVRAVRARPARYSLAPDAVIALRSAGVPQSVILAMSEKLLQERGTH